MIRINLYTAAMNKIVVVRLKGRRRRRRLRATPEGTARLKGQRRAASLRAYAVDKADPQRMARRLARGERWRAANPEKVLETSNASRVKRTYGLTREAWRELFEAQEGLCAICREPQPQHRDQERPDRLAVDHDHATLKVRGLLCHGCNHIPGKAKDNPALLRAAADYLEHHRVQACASA